LSVFEQADDTPGHWSPSMVVRCAGHVGGSVPDRFGPSACGRIRGQPEGASLPRRTDDRPDSLSAAALPPPSRLCVRRRRLFRRIVAALFPLSSLLATPLAMDVRVGLTAALLFIHSAFNRRLCGCILRHRIRPRGSLFAGVTNCSAWAIHSAACSIPSFAAASSTGAIRQSPLGCSPRMLPPAAQRRVCG
jgi:hypothetical protein